MFKGLAQIGSLIKQAGQLSGKLEGLTEELRQRRASGIAGGGLVEIEVNGLQEVLRCAIDPKLIERNDREMIEDLVVAAANQALAKAKLLHAEAMKSLTGGLDVPGLNEALGKLGSGSGP